MIDALTGIPNRAAYDERIEQEFRRWKRFGRTVSILAWDIDRFKTINDAYGHAAGDRVLVQVAQRLRSALRASDTAARTGGDEFVIIQCDFDRPTAVIELARRVVSMLSAPIDIGDKTITIGGSVGIAL